MKDIRIEDIDLDALVRDAIKVAKNQGEITYLTESGIRVAAIGPTWLWGHER